MRRLPDASMPPMRLRQAISWRGYGVFDPQRLVAGTETDPRFKDISVSLAPAGAVGDWTFLVAGRRAPLPVFAATMPKCAPASAQVTGRVASDGVSQAQLDELAGALLHLLLLPAGELLEGHGCVH